MPSSSMLWKNLYFLPRDPTADVEAWKDVSEVSPAGRVSD